MLFIIWGIGSPSVFSQTTSLFYKVQIQASYHQKLDTNALKRQYHLNIPIREDLESGYFKYSVGNFKRLKDAFDFRKLLVEKHHIYGAFVVSYLNNKRTDYFLISGHESRPEYRVQISASYRKKLDTTLLKNKLGLPYPIEEYTISPYYKYTIGHFTKFGEAAKLAQKIRKKGQIAAFVVKVREGKPFAANKKNYGDSLLSHKRTGHFKTIKTKHVSSSNAQKVNIKTLPAQPKQAPIISKKKQQKTPNAFFKQGVSHLTNSIKTGFVKIKRWMVVNLLPDNTTSFITIIYFLVIFLFFNVFFGLIVVIVHRALLQMKTKKEKAIKEKLRELISSFLFDEDSQRSLQSLKKHKSKLERQSMIDEILLLKTNLSGEVSQKLKELYYQLELDKDSMNKLKHRKWEIKAKGLLELEKMDIREAASKIIPLLNSKIEPVRVEAYFAYIGISTDNPFSFLNHIRYPLTVWEQLNIYNIIKTNEIDVPDFSQWFHSSFPSVVLFSLKMAGLFEQLKVAHQIVELLDHEDAQIRHQAIDALGNLFYSDASSKLQAIFSKETAENQRAILACMRKLQDETNLVFLKEIFVQNTNFTLRLLAAKALIAHGEIGKEAIVSSLKAEDKEGKSIQQHVFDTRI